MNLYKVLELEEHATISEIKKSYKRLAKIYHPDKCNHPNATIKFQEINYAYEILSNDDSRRKYHSLFIP